MARSAPVPFLRFRGSALWKSQIPLLFFYQHSYAYDDPQLT